MIIETLFFFLFSAWVAGFWTASIWPRAFELLIAHVKVLISGCANSLKLYLISKDLHHLLEDRPVCVNVDKWLPSGNPDLSHPQVYIGLPMTESNCPNSYYLLQGSHNWFLCQGAKIILLNFVHCCFSSPPLELTIW